MNTILTGHYFIMVDTSGYQKLLRAVPRKISLNKATVDME